LRQAGILMAVSSLPSSYGIGCFSKEAYRFLEFCKKSGHKSWQMLPLGPTGYGDSPYQTFSSFAFSPYYIDLEELIDLGLLTKEECNQCDFGNGEKVDYGKLYLYRFPLLKKAHSRFINEEHDEYERFLEEQKLWLKDYALFMAIKDDHHGDSWISWEKELRERNPIAMKTMMEKFKNEIDFYCFMQYFCRKQWENVHRYAQELELKLIGDIPIYIALDSADAWTNPELFQFGDGFIPIAVAGCPPDGFSPTGQVWGNPIYNWDNHKKNKFSWWKQRMRYMFSLFDQIRIDHFRGFDEFYSIPFGEETAENGKWNPGSGYELFEEFKKELGNLPIIAEDLGFLNESVKKLLKDTGYPGMKILEFAFDSREESDYLPHNYDHNCVVYTGTHDNDTVVGWFRNMPKQDREFALSYINGKDHPEKEIPWDFIRLAFMSVADFAIIPIQDYLGIGSEGRMNTPSTLGDNWTWRMEDGLLKDELAIRIKNMVHLYGRG